MAGLDDLNDNLQSEAGATPPVQETVAQDQGQSGYDLVADLLPVAQHKAFGAWCVRYKIGEDDPIFGEKLAASFTFSSAAAAARAAVQVSQGVNNIPDQIFSGAVRASDEVKGGLVSGAKAFVDAFVDAAGKQQKTLVEISSTQQSSILDAATIGAEKIRSAAENLTSSLDKAVKAKTDEGVGEFARAAAAAGKAAATSSMLAQLSRSAMVSVMAFLFACGIGAGGLWGYLLITHRVMPAGVTVMTDPFSHKAVMTLPSGATATLPGRIPDLP